MLKQLKSVFTRSRKIRSNKSSTARRTFERHRTEGLIVQRSILR